MNTVYAEQPSSKKVIETNAVSARTSKSDAPLVFTDIYDEEVNIVTWQRKLPVFLKSSVNDFVNANPNFQSNLIVTPKNVSSNLNRTFDSIQQVELIADIAKLVDAFCGLLEISQVGLRLSVLERAMCPKFHVDQVPCRLVTTYLGIATEWLPNHLVDRSKLGLGSHGLADNASGIYQHLSNIEQLNCGDVAILKGETWYNNENRGLVHRSPAVSDGERRLLLTLDVIG